jgi:hypothetical protein
MASGKNKTAAFGKGSVYNGKRSLGQAMHLTEKLLGIIPSLIFLIFVTFSPDGLNETSVGAQLAPQGLDMGIDGPGVPEEAIAPDGFDELISCLSDALMGHHVQKKVIFHGR